jgi:hypothetical protein
MSDDLTINLGPRFPGEKDDVPAIQRALDELKQLGGKPGRIVTTRTLELPSGLLKLPPDLRRR